MALPFVNINSQSSLKPLSTPNCSAFYSANLLGRVLMMVGGVLYVATPFNAFPVFILGRALEGLSVSGINVCVHVIMADKVTLKENAKNNGIFALFAGISYAIGPVISGFLTNKNWRWCFSIVGFDHVLALFQSC